MTTRRPRAPALHAARFNFLDADPSGAARRLRVDGPTLDVVLRATCRDGSACEPKRGRAMVDTGADRSAVALDALAGARSTGSFLASGVTGGEVEMGVYPVRLRFPGTSLPDLDVADAAGSAHLKDQGLLALIGRKELERGKLVYDGRAGTWAMSLDEKPPERVDGAPAQCSSLAVPVTALALAAALGLGVWAVSR